VQVLIDRDPYLDRPENSYWFTRGLWPCAWIHCLAATTPPFVVAYRRQFMVEHGTTMRIHVTADERYELFLDGQRIGRGSERGDPRNWFFETYDLNVQAGQHMLVALVWTLGTQSPISQMSVRPGLLVAPQADEHQPLLGTGVAAWEAKLLDGFQFIDTARRNTYFAVGATMRIDGNRLPWGFERGAKLGPGANGSARFDYPPLHMLKPATLPPMRDRPCPPGTVRSITAPPDDDTATMPVRQADHINAEQPPWTALLRHEQPLTIPPETRRRVIIDLDNYYCAYPELVVTGGKGSTVRLAWTEALYNEPEARTKGNRNEIDNKYFIGLYDMFLPDGGVGRSFRPLWWRSGRYMELLVTTAAEPLTIERVALHETRYPLEMETTFAASDARMEQIVPIMVRALQMCAHETYMDCPYYEQMMYTGDTRLEVLATYMISRDDRLPLKALRMFDASRLPGGMTQSRYPSREAQMIPGFSLWWVAMVYDYALWRDDMATVRDLMPGVRAVLDRYHSFVNADGLVEAPPGWNFMDWVGEWPGGVPPDGELGVSGVINWQFALVLTMAAQLETWVGEDALAARARRRAEALAQRLTGRFWDEGRGMFADDLARQRFSEHTQCMAILSGLLDEVRQARVADGLLHSADLARTTIYFSHYLLETCTALGHMDALFERLQLWLDLPGQGFKTTPEQPEPSRSDCHAWGAHPLFHYFASIMGIRPAAPGFQHVTMRPQLGPLTAIRGTLVHPRGQIMADLRVEQGRLTGAITLPDGVEGSLIIGNRTTALAGGRNSVAVAI
jgi:alpha-L-rhamnosidase